MLSGLCHDFPPILYIFAANRFIVVVVIVVVVVVVVVVFVIVVCVQYLRECAR